MNNVITLGSLFDGIGGFPLAAVREGILPVWASEIEAAPISITKRHFPDMRHLGDITKINGGDIQPVDIITFGSPCQDLSISGHRAGLDGERSGLFMQAIRIIKEMRSATNRTYPARVIWENVPGAFSTDNGRDFQTVIEEIAKVAEEGISIPQPSEKIGWLAAGAVLGDSWSLAWRVLNAQYWGCSLVFYEYATAAVSSLPQILQTEVQEKYFLSRKACQGIISRAKRRGKELPPMLKQALERQGTL
jgi:DNA (cytosine-5)-methyltransferase 1